MMFEGSGLSSNLYYSIEVGGARTHVKLCLDHH